MITAILIILGIILAVGIGVYLGIAWVGYQMFKNF